jgi:hypothetical protein
LAPAIVTATLVPEVPLAGVTDVSAGMPGVELIVNTTPLLVPPAVVALKITEPLAMALMVKLAVICDGPAVTADSVAPGLLTLRVAPLRSVPYNVTGMVAAGAPVDGVTAESTGAGLLTVKGKPRSAPTTIRIRSPGAAAAAIFNVAVICVALLTMLLMATPPPVTVSATPLRFTPVSVTGTLLLMTPLLCDIEVRRALVSVRPSRCALTTLTDFPFPWQFTHNSLTVPESISS